MAQIEIPMDSLLTITGMYSTLGNEIDDDSLTSLILPTATTATSNPTKVVIMEDTMAYVEALSDEQLEKLSAMLEEKESLLELPENPKEYTK